MIALCDGGGGDGDGDGNVNKNLCKLEPKWLPTLLLLLLAGDGKVTEVLRRAV
jgi:hypothetical protein